MTTDAAPIQPLEKDLFVERFELSEMPPRRFFLKISTADGLSAGTSR